MTLPLLFALALLGLAAAAILLRRRIRGRLHRLRHQLHDRVVALERRHGALRPLLDGLRGWLVPTVIERRIDRLAKLVGRAEKRSLLSHAAAASLRAQIRQLRAEAFQSQQP